MAQKRPTRAILLLQIEALKQRAVSRVATEGFEPRLDANTVGESRIPIVTRLLERSKCGVAISETRVSERQVVHRHVSLFRQQLNLSHQGQCFIAEAGNRLGVREPGQRLRIICIESYGCLKFMERPFRLTGRKVRSTQHASRRLKRWIHIERIAATIDRFVEFAGGIPHPRGADVDADAERVQIAGVLCLDLGFGEPRR